MTTCVNNLEFPSNRLKYQAKEDGFLAVGLVIVFLEGRGNRFFSWTRLDPSTEWSPSFLNTPQGNSRIASKGGNNCYLRKQLTQFDHFLLREYIIYLIYININNETHTSQMEMNSLPAQNISSVFFLHSRIWSQEVQGRTMKNHFVPWTYAPDFFLSNRILTHAGTGSLTVLFWIPVGLYG